VHGWASKTLYNNIAGDLQHLADSPAQAPRLVTSSRTRGRIAAAPPLNSLPLRAVLVNMASARLRGLNGRSGAVAPGLGEKIRKRCK
jgi:hypothetical protein